MLSTETILSMAREAGEEAREAGLLPSSIRDFRPSDPLAFIKPLPFLGDYIPQGWIADPNIDPFMVDSSGFGAPDEPADTIDQFIARLENYRLSGENYGFAICEVGQFQVVIRVYRPDPQDFTHTGKLTRGELRALGKRA
jgi:hypothetical protein